MITLNNAGLTEIRDCIALDQAFIVASNECRHLEKKWSIRTRRCRIASFLNIWRLRIRPVLKHNTSITEALAIFEYHHIKLYRGTTWTRSPSFFYFSFEPADKLHTLPKGNFFRNSSVLFVSPKTKSANFTWAPEYCAAINILWVHGWPEIAYNVCNKGRIVIHVIECKHFDIS